MKHAVLSFNRSLGQRQAMSHRPLLIMAGGTGGHVYPALAVAEHLRECGVPLLWLGTRHGLEARLVPAKGFRLLTITISGLRGKGFSSWLLAPIYLTVALVQSLLILCRRRPAVVLGMGGFVGGPGGIAAWLMRIPLLIHEQNAIVGTTNRWIAPLAHTVMEAFPGTFSKPRHAVCTGNPVRAEIAAIVPPDRRLDLTRPVMRILVLGGSQGARILNEVVPSALACEGSAFSTEVWHQSGPKHYAETKARYAENGVQARIEAYIDDVAAAYVWADVVVCRAGASTISELSIAGVASILVPYPYAVDDHQMANARHLVDAGAALLMPQPSFDEGHLAELLADLHASRKRLVAMARKARELARPDATQQVATLCMEVIGG